MPDSRIPGFTRGEAIRFTFDGESVAAYLGETVATALYAAGHRRLRASSVRGEPRGLLCNMGVCYDCLVYLGPEVKRACLLPVEDGMELRSWAPEEQAK